MANLLQETALLEARRQISATSQSNSTPAAMNSSSVNTFKEAEFKAKEEKERMSRAMVDKISARDGSPATGVRVVLLSFVIWHVG